MIIEPENQKNKELLFFLIAFFASSFIFFTINNLGKNIEDYFFFREIAKNPGIFTAQVNLENLLQERARKKAESKTKNIENKLLELSAKSATSVLFNVDSKEEKI